MTKDQRGQYNSEWILGQCLAKVGPRSYLVQNEAGQKFRRNRKFLRTTTENLQQPQSQQTISDPVPQESSNNDKTAVEKHNTKSSCGLAGDDFAAKSPTAATKTARPSSPASPQAPKKSTPTKSTRSRVTINSRTMNSTNFHVAHIQTLHTPNSKRGPHIQWTQQNFILWFQDRKP